MSRTLGGLSRDHNAMHGTRAGSPRARQDGLSFLGTRLCGVMGIEPVPWAAPAVLTGAVTMAQRWFLRLDGIAGESTDERHRGQIELGSWSFGVTNRGSTSPGSGATAARPDFAALQITAALSVASPKVFLAAATGLHISQALLSGVRPGSAQSDFLTIKLTDVTVTRSQLGAEPDAPAMDQFALAYARLEVAYLPTTATGAAGTQVTAGFDVAHGSVL